MTNGRISPAAITIVGLVLLVTVLLFVYRYQNKSEVTLLIAPNDATVYIDNKQINRTTTRLSNGEYRIRVEREGFESFQETVTINNNQTITVGLMPLTDEASRIAAADDENYLKIEEIAGNEAIDEGERFRSRNPIVERLPVTSVFYTVGYQVDPSDSESIIIDIRAEDGYREAALKQIRDWGFDPITLNIVVSDNGGPFNE